MVSFTCSSMKSSLKFNYITKWTSLSVRKLSTNYYKLIRIFNKATKWTLQSIRSIIFILSGCVQVSLLYSTFTPSFCLRRVRERIECSWISHWIPLQSFRNILEYNSNSIKIHGIINISFEEKKSVFPNLDTMSLVFDHGPNGYNGQLLDM